MDLNDRERIIELTPPVRVIAPAGQDLRLALDVLMFDELDLEIQVVGLEGSGADVTVDIQTGMQLHSATGWSTVTSFSRLTSISSEKLAVQGFLRYVRWRVSSLNGTAATFMISGIGRSWSKIDGSCCSSCGKTTNPSPAPHREGPLARAIDSAAPSTLVVQGSQNNRPRCTGTRVSRPRRQLAFSGHSDHVDRWARHRDGFRRGLALPKKKRGPGDGPDDWTDPETGYDDLGIPIPRHCRIQRVPNILQPVFYGIQKYNGIGTKKVPLRILYPTTSNLFPENAPIVTGCGRFPLVVFARGQCQGADDASLTPWWVDTLIPLARSGFVVAIPEYAPNDALEAADVLNEVLAWMYTNWIYRPSLSSRVGFAGHSTGAGVAAYALQNLTVPVQPVAFAALAGRYAPELVPPGVSPMEYLLGGFGALPALFMNGDYDAGYPFSDMKTTIEKVITGLAYDDADALDVPTLNGPVHLAELVALGHYDFVRPGVACLGAAGCEHLWRFSGDLLATFFSTYLGLPQLASLLSPALTPPAADNLDSFNSPADQKYLVGHLQGTPALINGPCPNVVLYRRTLNNWTVTSLP